jgi:hypothetical protein
MIKSESWLYRLARMLNDKTISSKTGRHSPEQLRSSMNLQYEYDGCKAREGWDSGSMSPS